MATNKRVDGWREMLAREGFRPYMASANTVAFKCNGLTYAVMLEADGRDEAYVQLLLPKCWSIDSEAEHAQALEVVNEVSAKMKVAKAFVLDGDVSFSIELWASSPEALEPLLGRMVQVLADARQMFAKGMRAALADTALTQLLQGLGGRSEPSPDN